MQTENRRRRLEILVEERKFVVERVLGERSRRMYLDFLRAKEAKVNAASLEFREAAAEAREKFEEGNADLADDADQAGRVEAVAADGHSKLTHERALRIAPPTLA